MIVIVDKPVPAFNDIDGSPLEAGYIYIGAVNQNPETTPITVYWDSAMTQPAAQPLRTSGGMIIRAGTPANLYASSAYSITVKNKNGTLICTFPDSSVFSSGGGLSTSLADATDPTKGDALVAVKRIATGAVAETVHSWIESQFLNVKDFGAKGDGTTDDAAAIQAAVNAITAGGTLFFPAGTYKISTSINVTSNGVRLLGAGRMGTKILPTATSIDAFHFGGGNVGSGPFRSGIESMQISSARKGVWFDKGSTSCVARDLYIVNCAIGIQNNGDYTVNPRNDNIITSIQRVEVENFSQYGFYFYHCGDAYISECQTTGSNLAGKSMVVESGCTAIYGSRCNFLSSATGIEINDTVGISPNPGSFRTQPGQMFFSDVLGDTCTNYGWNIANAYQVTLTDCWGGGSTNGVGFAIGASSKEITLQGCRALGNSQHGITVGANANGRVKIVGCHCYGNGYATSNTYDGINVAVGAGNFLIESNQCYNDTGMGLGAYQRYGIRLESGATDKFVVSGNVCYDNLSGGLSDLSTGTNKQVFGNLPKEDNTKQYFGNALYGITNAYYGSAAYDPPSTPNGAIQVQGLTVTGAQVGDLCLASFSGISGAGWTVTAEITSANNAAVTLRNDTGGTVDLPAGTLRVIALRMG